MPAELLTSRYHATLILTLSGSSTSSLLQPNMHAAVVETLSTAEADRSVAAVVLTGLDHFRSLQGQPGSAPLSESALEHLSDWIDTLQTFPKPVIAAVEKTVASAGLSLMLACDLIVAGKNSLFTAASPVVRRHLLVSQALPAAPDRNGDAAWRPAGYGRAAACTRSHQPLGGRRRCTPPCPGMGRSDRAGNRAYRRNQGIAAASGAPFAVTAARHRNAISHGKLISRTNRANRMYLQ